MPVICASEGCAVYFQVTANSVASIRSPTSGSVLKYSNSQICADIATIESQDVLWYMLVYAVRCCMVLLAVRRYIMYAATC